MWTQKQDTVPFTTNTDIGNIKEITVSLHVRVADVWTVCSLADDIQSKLLDTFLVSLILINNCC